jgi:4-hydroxybenzoate polyprenyltransferase
MQRSPLAAAAVRLRFGTWWRHIVPPLLALVYLLALLEPAGIPEVLRLLPLFLASVVGVAGFGYFFNDVCDLAADRAAGKRNAAAGVAPGRRRGLLAGLLALGLVPWLWLPASPLAYPLLALEVALLVAYSAPPLRLKERGLAGVVADALYGHLVPLLLTLCAFLPVIGGLDRARWPWLGLLAAWALAKGLRNITLHQLEDRKGDRRAAAATLVGRIRPVAALNAVNRLLLPVELLALAAMLAALAPRQPIWVGFAAFLLFTALKFSAWKLPFLPRRQLRFKFLFFLNDFYEEWLPVVVLLALLAERPAAWPLLIVHLALFPNVLAKGARDLGVIRGNLLALARPQGAVG